MHIWPCINKRLYYSSYLVGSLNLSLQPFFSSLSFPDSPASYLFPRSPLIPSLSPRDDPCRARPPEADYDLPSADGRPFDSTSVPPASPASAWFKPFN